jgi:hypothetical protein
VQWCALVNEMMNEPSGSVKGGEFIDHVNDEVLCSIDFHRACMGLMSPVRSHEILRQHFSPPN